MRERRPLQPGAFALDLARRNTAGTAAAQRGAEHAALTRRLRNVVVSLAPVRGLDQETRRG